MRTARRRPSGSPSSARGGQTGSASLVVEAVSVSYGGSPALDEVNLSVERAEVVAIVGANGAGKSSLLRSVAGMVALSSGRVTYGGQDLAGLATHERARLGVSLMPEGRELFGGLSVEENLRLGSVAARGRVSPSEIEARFDLVLTVLPELADRLGDTSSALSGGQQQMVALGRVLMAHPGVVLLDEPSTGLAPRVIMKIAEVIEQLRAELGVSVLLAEQNVRMAADMSDRVYGLRLGKVVSELQRREDGSRWSEQDVENLIGRVG